MSFHFAHLAVRRRAGDVDGLVVRRKEFGPSECQNALKGSKAEDLALGCGSVAGVGCEKDQRLFHLQR